MDFEAQSKKKKEELRSGNLTCQQNVKDFLSNIKSKDKKLNIILELNKNAEEIAKNLDKKREKKEKLGSLYGLVFLVKSNISVKDLTMYCASKTLETYKGTFNADVVDKLLAQDAILLGTVNSDEFASGSSGENSAFGHTLNPAALLRIPGGSSSGSAAAVAADYCDFALGSDTGGSIRNPASHCGIVGIKPSYGRVSRYGLIDLSMSLDQIGPLSKSVYTSAAVLELIAGQSEKDPTSLNEKVPSYSKQTLKTSYKIGIIKSFESFIDDENIKTIYHNTIQKLKDTGHKIIELDIQNIDLAIQSYYPIVYTEFFSGTRKFDAVKYGKKIEENTREEALRRILGGKEISQSEFDGAYYKKALKVKEIISSDFEKAFKKVDFILSPVTPMLPHTFGTELTAEQMYAYDAFTIPANLAGICGGVITKDFVQVDKESVPVGLQIFADKFKEDLMFQGLLLLDSLKANK